MFIHGSVVAVRYVEALLSGYRAAPHSPGLPVPALTPPCLRSPSSPSPSLPRPGLPGEDRRYMAARCLGELCRKMGERVLGRIIPILRQGAFADSAAKRQGVCLGLKEVSVCVCVRVAATKSVYLELGVREVCCRD